MQYKVLFMNRDYIKDIQDIKTIMEDRSRFLSLSGLSGILSGIYALTGAFVADYIARRADTIAYTDIKNGLLSPIVQQLFLIGVVVFILALVTAYYFTFQKAKRNNEKIWNIASIKALKSFAVPFLTGGVFVILLLWKGYLLMVASSTLIFYGLALYAASRYTYRDVAALGVCEVIIGLAAMGFPGYGLYFWALGFGVLHIIYGIIMHFKYDRVQPHNK